MLSVALWPAAVATDLALPGTSGERKRICSEEEVSEAQKTIRSQKWLPPSGRFCGTCSTTFLGIFWESGYPYPLSPPKPNDWQPLF
jgi:hypothetical protein